MFNGTRHTPEQTPPARAYAVARDEQLRRQLRPTLLIAFVLVAVHTATDLWNRRVFDPATLSLCAAVVGIPLASAGLTLLSPRRLAITTVAVVFDVAFSLAMVGFLFTPGDNLSGVAAAVCLKMLASAVLVPWPPHYQDRSQIITLLAYFAGVWALAPESVPTHAVMTPTLAAILGTVGCRRLDRNHRSLFEHSIELETSSQKLSETLAQERILMGVANEINELTDLPSLLDKLTRSTAQVTRSSFCTTFLVHEEEDCVELAATYATGGNPTHSVGHRFPNWHGCPMHEALRNGQTVAVADVHDQNLLSAEALAAKNVTVIAFTPIMSRGNFLGVLLAGRLGDAEAYGDREIAILTGIAATAGITINNSRLYERMATSESAYRDLFERANDLIFIADTDGGIHFANEAALRFAKDESGDLRQLRWYDFLSEKEASAMRRRISAIGRRPVNTDTTFTALVRAPGERREATLEVRARRISPPGQQPERFQCIARDVTERARRDEETRALLARLQESQRLQDEFVANMSHELRTPLNVIIGYADLIADDLNLPIKSDARSFLDRIGAASRALHRMVESILEYARLDRGRMTVIPTNFSSDHLLFELRALCNDVRSSLEVKLDLTQQQPIEFVTDYDRLYSVLSNLLLNALKFTPRGEIKLHLVQKGDRAVFEVRDTGIGIEPNELRSVFEPFRQVDGSDTRAFGGVGLGLAIVRRNVDLLQGNIDVDSVPDEGTVFRVEIPIVLAGATPAWKPNAA